MDLFGAPDHRLTPEHQRAENAYDGFKKAADEFKDHSLVLHDPAELSALAEHFPQVHLILEEADQRRLAVLEELKDVQKNWFYRHPGTLEALVSFAQNLEARTPILGVRKRMENRVLISLGTLWMTQMSISKRGRWCWKRTS